jgi:hypothetical protein
MQTALEQLWTTISKFVTQLELETLPRLTAFEITKRSWARVVETYDDVPALYKEFFADLLADGSTFPYAVLTPTYEGFLRRENEKLVCNPGHRLFILEKARNTFGCTCYAFEEINYVEVGEILLQAWMTVSGIANNGALTASTFKFNAVTDYLFTPLVTRMRTGDRFTPAGDRRLEWLKFDYLGDLNFKFMNFARDSILPGERVLCSVLQPDIRLEVARILGHSFYRMVAPAHLTILTDCELITIRDDQSQLRNESTRYGGIWTYIPLCKITSVSLAEKEDNLLGLSIHLPGDDHLELLFSAANRREVEGLCTAIAN